MGSLRRAFTLIELLIVVAIIAILALIAVPNFLEAQTRAKVARARNDLRALDMAAKSLLIDKGEDAYLIDFWDDSDDMNHWSRVRIRDVFAGVGNRLETTRRQVDVLAPLTTPIAYMSSLPRDPFVPNVAREISGGHSEIVGKAGNESYMYMDRDPIHGPNTHDYNLDGYSGTNPGRGMVPPLKYAEWWLIGYGPVLAPTGGGNPGVRVPYAYDPTNGTASIGCVFRRSTGDSF